MECEHGWLERPCCNAGRDDPGLHTPTSSLLGNLVDCCHDGCTDHLSTLRLQEARQRQLTGRSCQWPDVEPLG